MDRNDAARCLFLFLPRQVADQSIQLKTNRNRPKSVIFLSAILIFVFGLLYLFLPSPYIIQLINRTDDAVFFSKTIYPGERFTFRYIHSVQKTPVYEFYTIDEEGSIILIGTKVKSFGYGLPAPGPNDRRAIENGFLVIKDLNRTIGKLLVRMTFVQPMEFYFGEAIIVPRNYGKAGDLMEISAVKKNRLRVLLGL